jgi:hypothetical protein
MILYSGVESVKMPQPVTLFSGDKPMRKLQRLSLALVLTLTFGTYALAGITETPPAPTPPPPDPTASSTMASVVLTLIQTALSVR